MDVDIYAHAFQEDPYPAYGEKEQSPCKHEVETKTRCYGGHTNT